MPQESIDYSSSSTTTAKRRRLTSASPAVEVALILGGVVLIALPIYNNVCWFTQQAALDAALKSHPSDLSQLLPEWYGNVCLIAGLIMIVIGFVGSLARRAD